MYKNFLKRLFDIVLSFIAIVFLSPVFVILAIVGAIAMKGNPFFVQLRPGKKGKDGKERIFKMLKFRSMSNQKDQNGKFLADGERLNGYGRFIRKTSIDELPELFNIFIGDMSIVGPRPQLIRDLVFMTDEQRRRHTVKPGLTGLAQINGRNNITWEQKIEFDLEYIDKKMSFFSDIKIIFLTALKVVKRSDTVREGTDSDIDYGDWLLQNGRVTKEEYDISQAKAEELVASYINK